ncbi:hypothetical protein C731_0607 [Mycolicibacterium hassiacum DSM 44199]|uniref:Uncharacterized protein n=1 Tax=Mycolicibacterium hassiacum (strain DSM 44199 / CIP 105218 / JCM 12690 / 3849) TaxID=1122247 RepID=K5BCN7_MYCHD|nr:hypothetical protein [Mycolicibacterium hassiacum]EKF25370.1 hypothetical protein C731_0607 [Mycolicibacterium hassiacum DSM 44199]MDA4085624.1 hypothetical protein [Mycolicibacterium hassiacum DSM 44199]
MSIRATALPCFLAEWYRPEFDMRFVDDAIARLEKGTSQMCADGTPVRLVMTLAMPIDEVLLGIFTGETDHAVRSACERAGMPVNRLTPVSDARIAGPADGPSNSR